MNGEQKDTSLYKSILLQNLLNRRLLEKVQGIATCKKKRQEMRFILIKGGEICDRAPWSKGVDMAVDEQGENEENDENMESTEVDATSRQQGQARLRIRLVMKGKRSHTTPPSPKRPRKDNSDEEDFSIVKRRCGERCLSESPQPSSVIV